MFLSSFFQNNGTSFTCYQLLYKKCHSCQNVGFWGREEKVYLLQSTISCINVEVYFLEWIDILEGYLSDMCKFWWFCLGTFITRKINLQFSEEEKNENYRTKSLHYFVRKHQNIPVSQELRGPKNLVSLAACQACRQKTIQVSSEISLEVRYFLQNIFILTYWHFLIQNHVFSENLQPALLFCLEIWNLNQCLKYTDDVHFQFIDFPDSFVHFFSWKRLF